MVSQIIHKNKKYKIRKLNTDRKRTLSVLKKASFEQTCKKIGRKDRCMDEKNNFLQKIILKNYINTLAFKAGFRILLFD